ncbi:MAG: hypothetical protein Q9200_007213 [Gallowayella weberi]
MAKKSRLLSALDAHKNINHNFERQKKLQKQAAKRKRSKEPDEFFYKGEPLMSGGLQTGPDVDDVASEQDGASETIPAAIDTSHVDNSDSNSESSTDELASEEKQEPNGTSLDYPAQTDEQSKSASEASDDEEGIPLSDLSDLSETDKADIIPHQRLTINNTIALTKAYRSIALPPAPFSTYQTLTSPSPISIPDINDDLNRELAFHAQALSAAVEGRRLLKKEGIAFSRPNDYFAEMVKSDEQMGKIKGKMHEEAAGRKAAADARRQRDLRKFGKQVQVAKLQDRDKAKRETLEKINILKRSEFYLPHIFLFSRCSPFPLPLFPQDLSRMKFRDFHTRPTNPHPTKNAKTPTPADPQKQTSSISPSKTPAPANHQTQNPLALLEEASTADGPLLPRRASGSEKTRNSGSGAKSGSPRAGMRCRVRILVGLMLRG